MSGRQKPPRKPHKPKFPELPPKYSSSRELRNKAEKLRRNRLNGYLGEIKTLVPIIADKTKKSETTRINILRVSANYIRLQMLFPVSQQTGLSSPVTEGFRHSEALKGVVFLLSDTGRLLFIGESIEKYIGYNQLDLLGVSLYAFVHPGDRAKLTKNLDWAPSTESTSTKPASASLDTPSPSSSSKRTQSTDLVVASTSRADSKVNGHFKDASSVPLDRKSFYLRIREKPTNRTERPKYEHMHVIGHFRKSTEAEQRRTKELKNVFVGIMKLVKDKPITELTMLDATQDQYLTRHLPDGRIIYSDHRISTVTGYLPSEVLGISAFNFMLGEDLPWTTLALRTMFASSNGEGIVTYRLKTRFGGLICLQSRGFLELNKETHKIDQFVCVNTLIRSEDTDRYLEEQRERFTPYIAELQFSGLNCLPSLPEVPVAAGMLKGESLKRKYAGCSEVQYLVPKVLRLDSSMYPSCTPLSASCTPLSASCTPLSDTPNLGSALSPWVSSEVSTLRTETWEPDASPTVHRPSFKPTETSVFSAKPFGPSALSAKHAITSALSAKHTLTSALSTSLSGASLVLVKTETVSSGMAQAGAEERTDAAGMAQAVAGERTAAGRMARASAERTAAASLKRKVNLILEPRDHNRNLTDDSLLNEILLLSSESSRLSHQFAPGASLSAQPWATLPSPASRDCHASRSPAGPTSSGTSSRLAGEGKRFELPPQGERQFDLRPQEELSRVSNMDFLDDLEAERTKTEPSTCDFFAGGFMNIPSAGAPEDRRMNPLSFGNTNAERVGNTKAGRMNLLLWMNQLATGNAEAGRMNIFSAGYSEDGRMGNTEAGTMNVLLAGNTEAGGMNLLSAGNTEAGRMNLLSADNTGAARLNLLSADNTGAARLNLLSADNTEAGRMNLLSAGNTEAERMNLLSADNTGAGRMNLLSADNTGAGRLNLLSVRQPGLAQQQSPSGVSRSTEILQYGNVDFSVEEMIGQTNLLSDYTLDLNEQLLELANSDAGPSAAGFQSGIDIPNLGNYHQMTLDPLQPTGRGDGAYCQMSVIKRVGVSLNSTEEAVGNTLQDT